MPMDYRSKKAKPLDIVIAVLTALTALCAVLAPHALLEIMPDCLISKIIPGVCYGCGISHALLAIIHGDFLLAWQTNPLAYVVMPFMMFIILQHWTMIWHSYAYERITMRKLPASM